MSRLAPESSLLVTASNGRLRFGQKESKLLGANSYGILSEYLGIGKINNRNPSPMEKLQDASKTGLRVMRFWLDVANSDYWFQRTYGRFIEDNNHASYLSALDRLFSDSRENGLLLVPSFAVAFDQWTAIGNGESFWQVGSKTNLKYKDWIQTIATRYKDNPQVAWWEMADEPNYFASSGRNPANLDGVVDWARDAYRFLKDIDPNHIVSGGFNNTRNLDLQEFDRLNRGFDSASIHIYEGDLYRLEASRGVLDKEQAIQHFIETYSSYSHKILHKPIVFGEFNSNKSTPSPWFVEKFLQNAVEHVDVALIWSWEEGNPDMAYYVSPSSTPEVVATLQNYSKLFS